MPKLQCPPWKWQKAVRSIHQSKILPHDGFRPKQNYAAWCVDKFLAATAAKVLSKTSKQHTCSSATILTNIALSNSFMKDNIDKILPELYDSMKHLSDHSIGTVVEAAVGELFEVNEPAVEDLTRFLIQKAEDTPNQNTKGLLLNLGGKVYTDRIGGADHSPEFQAIAEFDGITTTGEGKSKKKAEQIAAEQLLSLRFARKHHQLEKAYAKLK